MTGDASNQRPLEVRVQKIKKEIRAEIAFRQFNHKRAEMRRTAEDLDEVMGKLSFVMVPIFSDRHGAQ
jgi:hypothetical protein